ncbi:hypothetical protein RA993_20515, partial [Mycobacteroides abscessus subsp. abscessus]
MSLEDLKQNAADGRLVLHLDDGAITKIINACEDYSRALAQLKQQARADMKPELLVSMFSDIDNF